MNVASYHDMVPPYDASEYHTGGWNDMPPPYQGDVTLIREEWVYGMCAEHTAQDHGLTPAETACNTCHHDCFATTETCHTDIDNAPACETCNRCRGGIFDMLTGKSCENIFGQNDMSCEAECNNLSECQACDSQHEECGAQVGMDSCMQKCDNEVCNVVSYNPAHINGTHPDHMHPDAHPEDYDLGSNMGSLALKSRKTSVGATARYIAKKKAETHKLMMKNMRTRFARFAKKRNAPAVEEAPVEPATEEPATDAPALPAAADKTDANAEPAEPADKTKTEAPVEEPTPEAAAADAVAKTEAAKHEKAATEKEVDEKAAAKDAAHKTPEEMGPEDKGSDVEDMGSRADEPKPEGKKPFSMGREKEEDEYDPAALGSDHEDMHYGPAHDETYHPEDPMDIGPPPEECIKCASDNCSACADVTPEHATEDCKAEAMRYCSEECGPYAARARAAHRHKAIDKYSEGYGILPEGEEHDFKTEYLHHEGPATKALEDPKRALCEECLSPCDDDTCRQTCYDECGAEKRWEHTHNQMNNEGNGNIEPNYEDNAKQTGPPGPNPEMPDQGEVGTDHRKDKEGAPTTGGLPMEAEGAGDGGPTDIYESGTSSNTGIKNGKNKKLAPRRGKTRFAKKMGKGKK